jgi:hypothetical protein
MGDEVYHADGQTDTTKLIVAFRNFASLGERLEKKLKVLLTVHYSVSV